MIAEIVTGSHVILKKNPLWWGMPPNFERIVVRTIEDTAALMANLLSGDIDMIAGEAGIAVDPAAEQKRETEGGYGLKGRLAALWTQCGLKQIAECDLMCSVEFTRFDEFWLPHLEGQAHSGSYVKSLPSNLRDALRDRLRQDILGTKPDGRFSISAKSLAVGGIE